MAGYMLNMESPSVTNILKAGHPVMALSGLLYGPTTVNQVQNVFHNTVVYKQSHNLHVFSQGFM